MNLKVNEIFYSLQGEGGRTGEASIFIRLAKCNLSCSYCDTDFDFGEEISTDKILKQIESFPCKWIIWTGGEPTLQLTNEIVSFFKQKGYKQAIETNGTKPLPKGLDYIACSPKQNFEKIISIIPEVDELRFPIKKDDPLPDLSTLPKAKHYFLSPIFDNQKLIPKNVNYCVEQIKKNPQWKLSLQMHKLIDIQ